jgi:hypothetical protein
MRAFGDQISPNFGSELEDCGGIQTREVEREITVELGIDSFAFYSKRSTQSCENVSLK